MKNPILKYLFLLFLLILTGCYCKTCLKSSYDFEISEVALKNAEEFIINKTGKPFFDENIYPDYINSKKVGENYELHYFLVIKDQNFVKEQIVFTVDSLGRVLENYDILGIPNSKDEPHDGIFNIPEEQAIKIAEENNLSKGIKPWKVSFMWSQEYDKYVWHILSIIKEMHYEDNYKASGEEIIIDPYDGNVILQRKWEIR